MTTGAGALHRKSTRDESQGAQDLMDRLSRRSRQTGQSPRLRLFYDGTDRKPVVTVDVVPVHTVRIEVHAARVVRDARIEGRRPVVAVGTGTVEIGIVPVAGGRKEDAIAIRLALAFFLGKCKDSGID